MKIKSIFARIYCLSFAGALACTAGVADAAVKASHRSHVHGYDGAPSNMLTNIKILGNARIESGTIKSYMVIRPGDKFNKPDVNRSLKALYATGLFQDVTMEREGHTLVVKVIENPIVNRIVFEGNKELKDEELTKEVALRPRAVYSEKTIASDRARILNMYGAHSRFSTTVTPQIVRLSNNRVDVIFKIKEGHETRIRKIAFVGNKFYSSATLSSVVSSKEDVWYRKIFSSSTQYNPQRIRYDAELLRRFYLQNGFVEFKMVDATGELAMNHKSFAVTYTIHEGKRYRLGKISVRSNIRGVTPELMKHKILMHPGFIYDGTAIAHNAKEMQEYLQGRGHPFAMVRTEFARNPEKQTVDLLFDIMDGPHIYVERIDINGNTVTRDSVIRRGLPVAEGDAYTPMAKKYTKYAIQDLGYFKKVDVEATQGSAPDRVNLAANVTEKPTGEFSLGGGYSTDVGVMGNVAVKQHNLLGTGVDAGFSGTIAYYERQADLSFTAPYFLGRNVVVGSDVFFSQTNNMTYQSYNEGEYGFDFRMGYAFNRYLSQSWTYSLVDRDVGNISYGQAGRETSDYGTNQYVSSPYVIDSKGWSLLSQLSTMITYDRRDNRVKPHRGYVLKAGGDFAGIGGNEKYMRGKFDGAYYVPLDKFTGNHEWTLQFKGGVGYMGDWGNSNTSIIDNFYLGGANLRGFLQGGVGPRSGHYHVGGGYQPNWEGQEDLIGGKFMYTISAQMNYPIPFGKSLGISARSFVDAGSLFGARVKHRYDRRGPHGYYGCPGDSGKNCATPITGNTYIPRVSIGEGISWKSPFGLVNIDLAVPLHKYKGDRVYPFRFGFGQQF